MARQLGRQKRRTLESVAWQSSTSSQPSSWNFAFQSQNVPSVQIHLADGQEHAPETPQHLNRVFLILLSSVRALESKLLAARDRLKIPLSINNLEFLTFKFMANIRPRSEMLVRGKVPYTAEDIVSYLKCSDKEFITKTGVP